MPSYRSGNEPDASDRDQIFIPKPGHPNSSQTWGSPPSAMVGQALAGSRVSRLFARLFNSYDPPRRPVGRSILGALFVVGVVGMFVATTSAIHHRNAFNAASACAATVIDKDCRATETAVVLQTRIDHETHTTGTGIHTHRTTRVSGYDIRLGTDGTSYSGNGGFVGGWVKFDPASQAFKNATQVGKAIQAEVFDGSVVAITAGEINVHSHDWPDRVVWSDVGGLVVVQLITILLLRSAGRGLWWRALGGRRRGSLRRPMRLLDVATVVLGVAGAVLLGWSTVPSLALIVVANVVLVLAVFVPAAWARRGRWDQSIPR